MTPREPLLIVRHVLPRCPKCNGVRLLSRKRVTQGGVTWRYGTCGNCKSRLLIYLE